MLKSVDLSKRYMNSEGVYGARTARAFALLTGPEGQALAKSRRGALFSLGVVAPSDRSRYTLPLQQRSGLAFLDALFDLAGRSADSAVDMRSLEEDIVDPLGMRDTALGANDPHKADVVARMPKSYKLDQDGNVFESTTFTPPLDYISAASGLISTVMDLAKYDIAIDRDIVYSPPAKQQI